MTNKKPKITIYLSGPMTGKVDYNYPLFNQVASEVRALGYRCINPAEFYGGHGDRTRQEYMRKSVQAVLNSTHMILLPDWRDSTGSTLECAIANEIGMTIQEYKTEPPTDEIVATGAGDDEVPPVDGTVEVVEAEEVSVE